MGRGKGGGSSWLTAVRRAFAISPSSKEKKKAGAGDAKGDAAEEEEEKKLEKKRWLFRKSTNHHHHHQQQQQQRKEATSSSAAAAAAAAAADQSHAIAVAAATAAAAAATAQVAAEAARLNGARRRPPRPANFAREHSAAVVIQTAFRGYLARRALRGLKGLVKLQALVRGHNVRKQADMTLRCMQALVRAQSRVRDRRARLSHDGKSSSFSFDARDSSLNHRPKSRDGRSCSVAEDWDDRSHTIREIQAMLLSRQDAAALKREKAFSSAFSRHHQQMWKSDKNPPEGEERQQQQQQQWVWSRPSCDQNRAWRRPSAEQSSRDPPVKTLEIDTARPVSYKTSRAPATPIPAGQCQVQVRSASPRCGGGVPNYMLATESARARLRSRSAPRQRAEERGRASTGGGGGPCRRRLAFGQQLPGVREEGAWLVRESLRSPSFKSACGRFAGEQRSNVSSSCCTEMSGFGEASPASTTDLRKWAR